MLTGLPGSGKSWRAAQIVEETGAAHISMDNELIRRGISIVNFEERFRIQPEVEATIPPLLERGQSVIAEFGSWSREERARIASLARSSGARTELHWLDASLDTLVERVLKRGGDGAEVLASSVLQGMAHLYERPTEDEAAEFDAYFGPTT